MDLSTGFRDDEILAVNVETHRSQNAETGRLKEVDGGEIFQSYALEKAAIDTITSRIR